MPEFSVADATLSYQEHGAGEPLVLVHGFAGTGEASWAGVLPALAEGYRVLAPDARGHGRSARGPARPARFRCSIWPGSPTAGGGC